MAVAAAGCASAPADAPRMPAGGPGTERPLPIPSDLAPHIAESIELGRQLYFLDKASAIGTDVVRDQVPDFGSRGVGGWLTVRMADDAGKPADAFGVIFFTKDEPRRTLFTVRVPLKGKPTVEEAKPPKVMDELGVRMCRARQAAIDAIPHGRRPINPVVLPGGAVGRPEDIAVYLLAAEQIPGEMVFGIHHRVLVSGDGGTVKQVLPLSKSALVIPPPEQNMPKDAVPVAAYVTQIVTDWPLETHVFVSLLHGRQPIYVITNRGLWLVTGDKIALVDDKPPKSRD